MAKKHKHPEHVNHERWLVSYADFITLLFAFFVVMFAVSQVDSKKVGRFSESFHESLEWEVFNEKGGQGLLPGVKNQKVVADVLPPQNNEAEKKNAKATAQRDQIRKALQKKAEAMRQLSGLSLVEVHGELVVRLPEKLMFSIGDSTIQEDGRAALQAIADELTVRDVRVRVEGHTDSTPIRSGRYPSNWELSMARAMAVVAFFLDGNKIPPDRLGAAGYGEFHPIASNETWDGRAQNRRVDLIIVADVTTAALR